VVAVLLDAEPDIEVPIQQSGYRRKGYAITMAQTVKSWCRAGDRREV
jgi:hypothetical protein